MKNYTTKLLILSLLGVLLLSFWFRSNTDLYANILSTQVDLTNYEFIEKAFLVGAPADITNECDFYFACDCCAPSIMFNADQTFYKLLICLHDTYLEIGEYEVLKDKLKLYYSGIMIIEEYNWNVDIDGNNLDYLYKDTIGLSAKIEYIPELCNNELRLFELDNNGNKYDDQMRESIMSQSIEKYEEIIMSIEKNSMKGRIDLIKKYYNPDE